MVGQGVAVTLDPVALDDEGSSLSVVHETGDVILDDDLEVRIMEAFEGNDRVDIAMIDLTVRDRVAVLVGAVDTEEDRRYRIGLLDRLNGIRGVQADGLITRGVDSHVPPDVTE